MPAASRANMGLAIKRCECLRNLTCLKDLACLVCLRMPYVTSEYAQYAFMGGIVIVIISIHIINGACKKWGSGAVVGQRGNAAVGKRGNAVLTTDGLAVVPRGPFCNGQALRMICRIL